MKQESNTRPSIFKWWGRRPSALIRAFISIALGSSESIALSVARGDVDTIERVRVIARGRRLLDPFTGSGVIPVEASRLGLEAVGQDVNPYAVAVAEAYSEICTGTCLTRSDCLWRSLVNAWLKARGLWCNGDECIIHVLLARCPPCTAPIWVASRRSGRNVKSALVMDSKYNLEWRDPQGLSPSEPRILLPKWLPLEANGYIAYAIEIYSRGRRYWLSLASRSQEALRWRKFLADTSRIARSIAESAGWVGIPLMDETRRLYRRGVTTTLGLLSWRQAASYALLAREARTCAKEMALVIANAMHSGSLLAMYYQPMAKVNPGLVVKSYWIPRNPVELNPFANTSMPSPPHPSSNPVGRGTLTSIVKRYSEHCARGNGCVSPPLIVEGDSRIRIPGSGYDIIATDPPYPSLHTYRDMSLLYAHASRLAGLKAKLDWEEIETRDPQAYNTGLRKAFAKAVGKAKDKAVIIIFLSSPSLEGISLIAKFIENIVSLGIGLTGIYPVVGENKGVLGRSDNKIVFVLVGVKGTRTSDDFTKPLENTWIIAEKVGLSPIEVEKAEKISRILSDIISIRIGMV